jgi:hypothetical protein
MGFRKHFTCPRRRARGRTPEHFATVCFQCVIHRYVVSTMYDT